MRKPDFSFTLIFLIGFTLLSCKKDHLENMIQSCESETLLIVDGVDLTTNYDVSISQEYSDNFLLITFSKDTFVQGEESVELFQMTVPNAVGTHEMTEGSGATPNSSYGHIIGGDGIGLVLIPSPTHHNFVVLETMAPDGKVYGALNIMYSEDSTRIYPDYEWDRQIHLTGSFCLEYP